MSADPKAVARQRFEQILKDKKSADEKADAVVWAAIAINTGLGAVPLGINMWTFMGVTSVMVTFLGGIYGHHLTSEGAGKLIKTIFASVGAMFFMFTLGIKFFAEVLKGAGIITMGGATVAGMALDAVLCGAVTFALGFTTKDYFKRGQQMSKEELGDKFKTLFEEGKKQVRKDR